MLSEFQLFRGRKYGPGHSAGLGLEAPILSPIMKILSNHIRRAAIAIALLLGSIELATLSLRSGNA